MSYNNHVIISGPIIHYRLNCSLLNNVLEYPTFFALSEKKGGICCVINQPQVPLRLPCFDFRTIGKDYSSHLPELTNQPDFIIHSLSSRDEQLVHSRDDVHRVVLIHDYSEFLLHMGEFQPIIRTLIFFDDQLIVTILRHFVKILVARLLPSP